MKESIWAPILFLLLASCSLAEVRALPSAPIEAELDSRGCHRMELACRVGDVHTFTLRSHPGTGYCWQLDAQQDCARVEIIPVEPESRTDGLVGAPGEVRVIVSALKPGVATFTLSFVRPWEKESRAARSVQMTLTIEPEGE